MMAITTITNLLKLFILFYEFIYQNSDFFQSANERLFWIRNLDCHDEHGCVDKWIKNDVKGFEKQFQEKVIGQQVALKIIVGSIRSHTKNHDPSKSLVLSFHGSTGLGKTLTTQMIADALFIKGTESICFNIVTPFPHFPHKNRATQDLDELKILLRESVRKCAQAVFVFDDVDKFPRELINGIKPFVDFHRQIDGLDYRRTTFVFISNRGGEIITDMASDYLRRGMEREDIEDNLKNISLAISLDAFNSEGGFHNSDLISSHLIDHYVPFLPLDKFQVELCVKKEFMRRGINPTNNKVRDIVNKIHFHPEDVMFSTTGCKHVEKLVGISINENLHFKNHTL